MKVLTLWEMIKFSAEKFHNISSSLKWMESADGSEFCGFSGPQYAKDQHQKNTREFFHRFAKELEAIGCKTTAGLAYELGSSIAITTSKEEWSGKLNLFRHAVFLEMKQHLFLWVPLERAKFFNETEKTFGDEVANMFPKALSEIREAGNCYATGCSTACVFHLMRVMEIGLRAVYISLGLSFDPHVSWGNVLKNWSPEEIKGNPTANAKMMADLSFYQDVRATVSSVKDSWRNGTMHFDRSYNESEALEIMTAVRGFMKCVAAKINEDGVAALLT